MIVGELAALGVAPPTPLTDVEGLDPDAAPVRPAESVRVTEADPLRLGVHAAISAPGMPDDGPSEYVPRDSIPPSQGSGPVLDPGQQTPDGHALDVIAEIAGEALCGGSVHGQGENPAALGPPDVGGSVDHHALTGSGLAGQTRLVAGEDGAQDLELLAAERP